MKQSKFTSEDLLAYITGEMDHSKSDQIEEDLKSNSNLKAEYEELIKIRTLHAETLLPLLNTPMPEKTKKLIQSVSKASSYSKWIKYLGLGSLAPLAAVLTWVGISTAPMMVAELEEKSIKIEQ